jgi:hypothetical protein
MSEACERGDRHRADARRRSAGWRFVSERAILSWAAGVCVDRPTATADPPRAARRTGPNPGLRNLRGPDACRSSAGRHSPHQAVAALIILPSRTPRCLIQRRLDQRSRQNPPRRNLRGRSTRPTRPVERGRFLAAPGPASPGCGRRWSAGAVDRNREGGADLAHPDIGHPAEPTDKHRNGDALDRVQIHRRPARDRILTRFESHLARQSSNGRRAGCNECAAVPWDHRVP